MGRSKAQGHHRRCGACPWMSLSLVDTGSCPPCKQRWRLPTRRSGSFGFAPIRSRPTTLVFQEISFSVQNVKDRSCHRRACALLCSFLQRRGPCAQVTPGSSRRYCCPSSSCRQVLCSLVNMCALLQRCRGNGLRRCGHCKHMEPAWHAASDALQAAGSTVKLAKIDASDPVNQSVGGLYGVRGYPTMKTFTDGALSVRPLPF